MDSAQREPPKTLSPLSATASATRHSPTYHLTLPSTSTMHTWFTYCTACACTSRTQTTHDSATKRRQPSCLFDEGLRRSRCSTYRVEHGKSPDPWAGRVARMLAAPSSQSTVYCVQLAMRLAETSVVSSQDPGTEGSGIHWHTLRTALPPDRGHGGFLMSIFHSSRSVQFADAKTR